MAVDVGQGARRQRELHRHGPACREPLDQEIVFGSQGRAGDRRHAGGPVARAGVRQPIVGTAGRAHQRADRTQPGERRRGTESRPRGLRVGLVRQSVVRQVLVERHAHDDDLALDVQKANGGWRA